MRTDRAEETIEYTSWHAMKQRCTNKNHKRYHNYGGRGITFDPRWARFNEFLKDMGECPEGMTLDRRNNDGNYNKDNCRWLSNNDQQRNRSNNVWIDYQGTKRLLIEICEELDFSYDIAENRYRRKWDHADLFRPMFLHRFKKGTKERK